MDRGAQLDARALNRASLARQLLLEREPLDVVDAVGRLVGLQAQAPPSPYLALFNRIDGFDPSVLDATFADGRIVKATLLRQTLHAVRAEDHPLFRSAMQPTLRSRFGDPRFTRTGLTVEQLDALAADVLAFAAQPRRPADIEAWIAERTGVDEPRGAWWAMRWVAALAHAPAGGPWAFTERPAYRAADPALHDPEASLAALARRYLSAYGPASPVDFAQFAMVTRARAKVAFEGLQELGGGLFDVAGAALPDPDTPAPARLLGMWDNLLLAHADRSRFLAPEVRGFVTRRNGDVLPTLLVDGRVAGVWRVTDDGIEATAFHALADGDWGDLEREAHALWALIEPRDTRIYRRHHNWWADMPAGLTRILAP